MAKGKIYSGDTLCLEIGGGAKARKRFQDDSQAHSDSQPTDPSSTSQSTGKVTGVHFNDLDYVTFNPIIDPEPGSCFNCWERGHPRGQCPKPKRLDFCHNCGRRDVRVTTCPRCSRAYVGFWKKSRRDGRRQACEFYDAAAKSLEMEQNKEENEETECQMEPIGNDQDEDFSSTESGYCKDMVVDEEKRSLKFTVCCSNKRKEHRGLERLTKYQVHAYTYRSNRRRMWSSEKTIADPAKNRSTSSRQIVKAAGMIFGNLDFVVFDPEIDCPPRACYNCWGSDHHSKNCQEPKSREYCCNCGRKDVLVHECARCARAFFEQNEGMRSWIRSTFMARKAPDEKLWDGEESQSFYSFGREDGKASKSCREDCKKSGGVGSESPPAYTEPNDLFACMRARKVQNDGVNLDDTRMAERHSFGEGSVLFDDRDEEEKKSSRASGEPIHEFLNLMDAVKHLSVATQEVVVLQFMTERKKKSEM